jgi:chromosome partitioning protein
MERLLKLMKTIAVANQKGGVGKTTTVVSIAGVLARKKYKVLLIDLDPHGSMTSYFKFDPDEVEDSVYTLFQLENRSSIPSAVVKKTPLPNISLIPASTALATLDRQLGTRSGMGLVIASTLKALSGRFDFALLDCPPILGVLMVNALAASDKLIIPSQTEFLAMKGLERMVHTLEMIQKSRHVPLPYMIVPTMYDKRTRASVVTLSELKEKYAGKLWDDVIPIDTAFRDASKAGLPLTIKQPWTKGSMAYRKLIDDLDLIPEKLADEEIQAPEGYEDTSGNS